LAHRYISCYVAERDREAHKALSLTDKPPRNFLRWKESAEKQLIFGSLQSGGRDLSRGPSQPPFIPSSQAPQSPTDQAPYLPPLPSSQHGEIRTCDAEVPLPPQLLLEGGQGGFHVICSPNGSPSACPRLLEIPLKLYGGYLRVY